jgi:hypothetical protein
VPHATERQLVSMPPSIVPREENGILETCRLIQARWWRNGECYLMNSPPLETVRYVDILKRRATVTE